jgi:hypothetical protein
VAAGLYAIFSNLVHFVPYYTNSERVYGGISPLVVLLLLELTRGEVQGDWRFMVVGILIALCAWFKVVAFVELALPVGVCFLFCSYRAVGDVLANACYFMVGLLPIWLSLFYRLVRRGVVKFFSEVAGALSWMLRYKRADVHFRAVKVHSPDLRASGLANGFAGTSMLLFLGVGYILCGRMGQGGVYKYVLLSWLVGSGAALVLQRVFSPGHWVPLLSPLCVLAGTGLWSLTEEVVKSGYVTTAAGVAVVSLFASVCMLFVPSLGHSFSRKTMIPLLDALCRLARFLADNTDPDETVFCWGWQPQIYVLAGRRSACPSLGYCEHGYLDLSRPRWRGELVWGFLKNRPRYFVVLSEGAPHELLERMAGVGFRKVYEDRIPRWVGVWHCTYENCPSIGEEVDVVSLEERLVGRKISEARQAVHAGRVKAGVRLLSGVLLLRPEERQAKALLEEVLPCWRQMRGVRLMDEVPLRLEVLDASSGMKTARVVGAAGQVMWLHNKDNPEVEARRIVSRSGLENKQAALVLGMGLGYLVEECLRRLPEPAPVVVIERSFAIARACFSLHPRWKLLMERAKLICAVGTQPEDTEFLRKYLKGRNAAVILHEPGLAIDPAYYQAVVGVVLKGATMART